MVCRHLTARARGNGNIVADPRLFIWAGPGIYPTPLARGRRHPPDTSNDCHISIHGDRENAGWSVAVRGDVRNWPKGRRSQPIVECGVDRGEFCNRLSSPCLRLTRWRRISAVKNGAKRFHHSRTVSWQTSMPRSNSRFSTLRSDNGKRTYSITTSRITSGKERNYRNGRAGFRWRDVPLPYPQCRHIAIRCSCYDSAHRESPRPLRLKGWAQDNRDS